MKTLGILVIGIVICACFYQHSTEASDAQDALLAGLKYYESQNYEEALKWLQKAADQGNTTGQSFLGSMYYFGRGVPQNYEEALKWFRKAADQGDAKAQVKLGHMYYFCLLYTSPSPRD